LVIGGVAADAVEEPFALVRSDVAGTHRTRRRGHRSPRRDDISCPEHVADIALIAHLLRRDRSLGLVEHPLHAEAAKEVDAELEELGKRFADELEDVVPVDGGDAFDLITYLRDESLNIGLDLHSLPPCRRHRYPPAARSARFVTSLLISFVHPALSGAG